MEKQPHEPGEPTKEDLAKQFSETLGQLHGFRELFLSAQGMHELTIEQADNAFQRFETEKIEHILSEINEARLPWKSHPDTVGDDASDSEATADTYIDPVGKKVVRYETTEAEGTEQVEIVMSYRINSKGNIERSIITETEEIDNSLESFEHPAFVPLELQGGEKVNTPTAPEEIIWSELDIKQAEDFVNMMRKIVNKLAKIYTRPGWLMLPDTERNGAFKIERIDE